MYSLDQFCASVDEILKHENVDKLNLYGLSLGGILAQVYLRVNPSRVEKIVLSHTCSAKSKRYRSRQIIPLTILKYLIPFISNRLIRLVARNFAGKIQGLDVSKVKEIKIEKNKRILSRYFAQEFYRKYFNKTLLKTWINLHLEFYHRYHHVEVTLRNWNGSVLVIRTDNDPLMQDEGDFKKMFSRISVVEYSETGHLSFYYRSTEILGEIKKFLQS